MIEYSVVPLAEVVGNDYPALCEELRRQLREFQCKRSSQIQEFARGQVFDSESRGLTRTYLLVTESLDTADGIDVAGFFSIGLTAINLDHEDNTLGKNKRKDLRGSGGVVRDGAIGAMCIAELARSDKYTTDDLPGPILLEEAKTAVGAARQLCGGRVLVVDTRRKVFDSLYEPAGFSEMRTRPSPNEEDTEAFVVACCNIKDW